MSARRATAACVVALLLAGCGGGSSTTAPSPGSDRGSGSGPVASPPHSIATGAPSSDPSPGKPVGSPEHPVVVTVGQAPLQWTSVPGPTKDLVTVGDGWTLTVPDGGAEARLRGPHPMTIRAGDRGVINDAFLDDRHALVVSEDRLAHDADRATLVDLGSGRTTTLDAGSDPPTVSGGTWALGSDTLVHATSGPHHSYCLATVDLSTGRGTTGWCAPPRHGFSRAAVSGSAGSMMTFDDHHPSCRTLVQIGPGSQLTPIPGVTPCKGWDSSLTSSGAVWSVVPKDRRIEAAHFYAHTAGGWWDLGPGASGSLVTCAGSAYFTRDPASRADPATLLRWSPDTGSLTVAYASKATGNAFLSPPRCGGSHLTLTSYSDAGDEQVTTDLAP